MNDIKLESGVKGSGLETNHMLRSGSGGDGKRLRLRMMQEELAKTLSHNQNHPISAEYFIIPLKNRK